MALINVRVAADTKNAEAGLHSTAKAIEGVGRSADKTQPKLSAFEKTLTQALGIGVGIAAFEGIARGLAGIASAAAQAVADLAALGSQLSDLSAKTGLGTDALQELSYAGSLVGVSLDQVGGAVLQMEKRIAAGDEAFAKLGLSTSSLLELKPEEAFFQVAAAVAKIQNPTEQAAAAMGVFGRSGAEVLPLIKGGLEDLRLEAHAMGAVLSGETVAAADRLDDAMTKLDGASGALKNSLAAIALESGATETIEDLAVSVGNLARTISENKELFADMVNVLFRIAEATPGAIGNVAQAAEAYSLILKTGAVLAPEPLPTPKTPATFEPGVGLDAQLAAMQQRALTESNRSLAPEISKTNTLLREQERALRAARLEAFELSQQIETVGDDGMEGLGDALLKASTSSLTLSSATQTVGLEFGSVTVSAEDMAAAVAGVNAAELGAAKATTAAATATQKATADAKAAAAAAQLLGDRLLESGQALVVFGSQVGGAFGGLLTGLGMATQAWGQYEKSAKDAQAKTQLAVAALGALAAATGASLDSASASSRGLAGAAMGAQIGAAAGPWGAAAGAVVGGIIGAFKRPSWVKVGQEAGKVLGVEVSKELAQAIEATSKDLGISVASASLLHISDAIAESGQSASAFAGQIGDLMGMIALGGKGAEEGMLALDDVFGQVRDSAQGVGDAMTVAMLQAAEATGTLTDGMREFVSQQNALMATGAGTIGKALESLGSKQLGGEMGTRAAQFFAVGFQAAIEEQGLLGAIDSLGDQALSMFKKFQETGNQSAAAMVAPFAQLEKAIGGDSPAAKGLRSQLELLQGMGDVFEGAANQGLLTAELQQAFGGQLLDTFNAMLAKSIDSKTAMTAIMPELQNAVSAARELGLALDPATQGLVDQATAMGFSFPVEPMQQVVDLLKVMVTTLGGELPASVQQTSSAMSGMQGATTSSLGAMQTAAMETSSTMAAAFDGVGAEITTAIAPAAGAIESQLQAAFDAGILGAQNLAALLGQLDSTTLTIPFKFTGDGLPGGGGLLPLDVPMMARGGTVEPRPGGQLTIIGEGREREHVIPDSQLKAMLRGSRGPTTVNVSVSPSVTINEAQNPEATRRILHDALDRNVDGVVTKIKRTLEGRR